MARLDPAVDSHLEWMGFVRPIGLVVAAPALVRAGAILERSDTEGQRLLSSCLEERTFDDVGPVPYLPDFRSFASKVLGWSFSPKGYAGTAGAPIPPELELPLPEYGETLRPDLAVREPETSDGSPWQLLVRIVGPGDDFDRVVLSQGRFEASEHGRMERLLREKRVPAGLLFNGRNFRLLSAPRGESSGWVDFQVADMAQTAGRPIASALRLLLSEQRLLALPRRQRLAALLADSRRFQNEVSERLAEQVLHALYELLRGFQAAHEASGGELLREPLAEEPDEVYRGLLTVVLRLVFLLYAEQRDMLPGDDTFLRSYSLGGLYDRLREDAAMHLDLMDQRYGAWPQLVTLFRMVHDGATWAQGRLPSRRGGLFDPDRYPFLEGRGRAARQVHQRIDPPLVPDGVIWRVLEDLLVLDGERISYRALDVEQIGSVYETMMGFRLQTATGRSVAIKSQKRQGAPTAVDLEEALAQEPAKRAKWIAERADRKPSPGIVQALTAAVTVEDAHAALAPVVDQAATPDLVPKGAMVLQPSAERRRSGSHYTPRILTEPIVRTTLEPILARLRGPDGTPPTADQVLALAVCDPAMGSGAFLVETCRQLGELLLQAWQAYGGAPEIPADEDAVLFARRLVAQRCLYGVDRNPVAVDLAKMSLWLVTLARDHPLTFVDHALRHGDSLVGLTRGQIEAFYWKAGAEPFDAGFEAMRVEEHTGRAAELRAQIRDAGEDVTDWELRDLWDEAHFELGKVRLFGDLVVQAYFGAGTPKEREAGRTLYAKAVTDGEADQYRVWLEDLRDANPPLAPFHWELEFPEVFERPNPGFDAIVGNPPFGGKNTIAVANLPGFPDWLKLLNHESHGNADLVAHFFRKAFDILRRDGTFGLVATNTIGQGDTRASGLRWICTHGGEIYSATRRYKWPGKTAAVVVSFVHVVKGCYDGAKRLDGREVENITAFLFHEGGHEDPARLRANAGKSFQGSIPLGIGFTFDDRKADASPLTEMESLIESAPQNSEAIFPYIGYAEVASSPTPAHHRYVINFGERSEEECRQRWPDLLRIVEEKVRPERAKNTKNDIGRKRAELWWQYGSPAKELYEAASGLDRVLIAGSQASTHFAFAFLPTGFVYSSNLTVIAVQTYAAFAVLQSRPHEVWARFFMSTLEDRLAYTPTTCFETFPFPDDWETAPALEEAGRRYYEFRASLMIRNSEGLTDTYNRFNNPNERDADIATLRELHAAMDRAVLDAYGWTEIPTHCEFIPDYEDDEEEGGRRKKPWRYRWPDEIRDDVLALLLALNAEWAAAEARSGATNKRGGRRARAKKAAGGKGVTLFS